MISSYKFEGIEFLVVLYIFNSHQCRAVVNIQRQTITTIDMTNGKIQAKYLGQAIDIKLG